MTGNAQNLLQDGLDGLHYRCYESSEYEGVENEAYLVVVDEDLTGTITVPETVTQNGIVYTVTVIDENSFQQRPISAIVLSDGIRRISEDAFSECKNLTSVYIGKNIDYIDEDAFSGCDALRDFTILAEIPPRVDYKCDPIDEELRAKITIHAPKDFLDNYEADKKFWGTFGGYDDNIDETVFTPTAIGKIENRPSFVNRKSFDLQGRQLSVPGKGIIIRQENGQTRKEITK